jgi:two-component system response regulator AtoC
MSHSLQSKLLQVLQDREFSRLGGKKDIWVDVRVLAATNKNIEEMVNHERFREDLYYRLNVVNVTLPPLRERKEEIPVFIEYFLDKFSKKYEKKVHPLSSKIMRYFKQHHWLGNVRELENVIQRYVILENEKMIMDELTYGIIENATIEKGKSIGLSKVWPSLKDACREATIKAESETILKALQITNWNRKRAAQLLNISYKALLYKIKDSGLDKLIVPLTA